MSQKLCISVIVPFFNAEPHIKKCIEILVNQDTEKSFEIIMIDDASTDNSRKIVEQFNSDKIKLFTLSSNVGPSGARNRGIKAAQGEYIFFLDADDTISKSTLKILYKYAKQNDYDLVFCDKKRIENLKNQRANIFAYDTDKIFESKDITYEIKKRINNPSHTLGVIGCHGKLIKKSLIIKNNLFFEENLRFLEDEIFILDILGFCKRMFYVREQLYTYNINPTVKTGRSEAFNHPFPISNFKLMKNHVEKSLLRRKCSTSETNKYSNQSLIYFIIYTLVSYSLCIFTGKVEKEKGISFRKKIIRDVVSDIDIFRAVKNYSCSKEESPWIPRAIGWRSSLLLEFFCNQRAKQLLKNRFNKK